MRYSKNKAQKQEATGARRMGFLDTCDYRAFGGFSVGVGGGCHFE